jgi:uncharacterized SAM-binding protein YcdF (DUF218 family)
VYLFVVGLAQPFLLLTLLSLGLAITLACRNSPQSRLKWLLLVSLAGLYLWCLPATAWLSWQVTTSLCSMATTRPADLDAIVVLGGGVSVPNGDRGPTLLNAESLRRCMKGADIYRAGPACPILVTGGKPDPKSPGMAVAKVMGNALIEMGIERKLVMIEDQSNDTAANARESARLIEAAGWKNLALVSTAVHLPRGVALFKAEGCEVIAIPCQSYLDEFEWGVLSFLPAADAAQRNQEVFHEAVSYLLLKLRGRL